MRLDSHDALRGLFRDRIYSFVTVVTFALTIGATTAVFSIVNGVLLRPLAYRESHQIVSIREIHEQVAQIYPTLPVNEQHFDYWRQHAQSFDSLAQYWLRAANLSGAGEATPIGFVRASGTFFEVLQVRAEIGRTLTRDDERKDRSDVVVIGHALWRQRFEGDSGIVGRSIAVDGRPYVVVGVLPADFQIPEPNDLTGGAHLTAKVDVVAPLRVEPDASGWLGDFNNAAIGRLKAGITLDRARAELDLLQRGVSEIAAASVHEPVDLRAYVIPLSEAVVGNARRGLLLLLAAIGAVLLIACSNLANLSLSRAISRLRDAAIRTALGASRSRLVARVIFEQLVLAVAGGVLGIAVARIAIAAFVRRAAVNLPRAGEVDLDWRVVLFASAVSIAAGLLVALLPAWRIGGADVQGALRAGGLGTTVDRGGLRARSVLLTFQVALSVTLLVVTALLTVSLARVARLDRGFAADRVLVVKIVMPAARYSKPPDRVAAYDRILAAVHALPGVGSVSWTSTVPLTGEDWVDIVSVAGETRRFSERPKANYRFVAPEFFATLGMTIVRGHAFGDLDRDPARPAPALVSERAAAQVWPGQDAIGKVFTRGQGGEQPFEVVGVVHDARTTTLERQPPLMVYVPYWRRSRPSASLLVHTAAESSSLVAEVRHAVARVDPDIAIGDTRPLASFVDAALEGRRYQVEVFVAFAVAALTIAIIGVYAVTSYGISRRRREMNIRLALGAAPSQVVALVVRQGFSPVAAGLGAGAIGAVAAGTLVASLLFDVRARDPLVIAAVVSVVGVVGLLACALAARQGLTLNPVAALRDE
jgi:predicted permease